MEPNGKKYIEKVDSFFEAPQTPESRRQFYQWLLDDTDRELKELAMKSRFEAYDVDYDEEEVTKALLQVHSKIKIPKNVPTEKRVSIGRWTLRVAAALIPLFIIAGSALVWLNRASSVELLSFHAPVNETKQILLSCLSYVWIKDGSSLGYTADFNGTRELMLSGRAHFAVERSGDRPFLVHTDRLKITVLGTEFTVKELIADNRTVITVASGSVQVESTSGEQFLLSANHQLTYNHSAGRSTVSQLDAFDVALSNIWKKERVELHQLSLSQVMQKIDAFYFNRTIDLSGFANADDTLLSFQFDASESIENTLTKLQELTGAFYLRFEGTTAVIYN